MGFAMANKSDHVASEMPASLSSAMRMLSTAASTSKPGASSDAIAAWRVAAVSASTTRRRNGQN